jgi:probable rRNA maturation factor
MGVHFELAPEYEGVIDLVALNNNIQMMMVHLDIPEPTNFSIAFVNDTAIQELNLKFREVDSPTDVLSFPVEEVNPEDNSVYIGDIIISMETAMKQSQEQSITPIDEIHLLIIHGFLHLLGYDHDTEEKKEDMWVEQSELLDLFHCPANPDRYAA